MKQIETGSSSVFRFDDVLDEKICDRLCEFILQAKSKNVNPRLNVNPWFDNDTLDWRTIRSDYLFAKIESYRELVTELVSKCYGEVVFPHFTDLVLWRAGRSMDRHHDNGYSDDEVYMRQRAYTTVTYLNDNFTGGEGYIATENGDYINVPKKGSIVILKSTPDNAHGVNEVTSGNRITLPIWFTKFREHRETYNVR